MNLLFICTHNRCRSILCEAIANQDGDGLVAKSAGSTPAGVVHPLTLQHLKKHNYDTAGLVSESWDAYQDFADVVITVCDQAAGESCPVWFGRSIQLHWGLPDPSKLEGAKADDAFSQVIATIQTRTKQLSNVAQRNVSGDALKQALIAIGAQAKQV